MPDFDTRKRRGAYMREASMAWELPIVLVGTVLIAGGLGYLLDRWLHTGPALMLILGLVGFAAGIWDMLRRLSSVNKPPPSSPGPRHGS